MDRANSANSATTAASVYDDSCREQLRTFYAERTRGVRFWAYDFDYNWKKLQRGVAQESELAELASRWVDFQGARVLVIGSYFGSEAIAYALRGAHVSGIDLDESALAMSRRLARGYGVDIDFRYADATTASLPLASFDYVSCAQVLEHLPPEQQPRILAAIWRCLKPGGVFWLDTPNQLSWKDRHDTGLPIIHWLPRAVKVPLAKALGRAVLSNEPAFGQRSPYLHYYVGYFQLKRMLGALGPFEILSRYKGYADIDHYCAQRCRQGRDRGKLFPVKATLLRTISRVWNWNWFSGIRMMIRKLPQ